MKPDPIAVLVADDSKVARLSLVRLLESDPRLRVIGAVASGQAALEFVQGNANRPDVILMDIHMPGMDGFETTRRIMETRPVPIIICSATTDPGELASNFRLMEAGAVACLRKPLGSGQADLEAAAHLLQTVRLMSEVKVVRRWPRSAPTPAHAGRPEPVAGPKTASPAFPAFRAIGIGASTGGPPVLHTVLSALPKEFPVPILIVQHIAPGFLPGLAEWLNESTGFPVQIATQGVAPLPGHAYLAPDDFQMGLDAAGRVHLSREGTSSGLRPSVAHLFRSLADRHGPAAIGVLLSGMGKDGAAELKRMRDRGAITVVQDRESSAVHGMPGEAIGLGAAMHVAPAGRIASLLLDFTGLAPK